jgi:hypothetical protein
MLVKSVVNTAAPPFFGGEELIDDAMHEWQSALYHAWLAGVNVSEK